MLPVFPPKEKPESMLITSKVPATSNKTPITRPRVIGALVETEDS